MIFQDFFSQKNRQEIDTFCRVRVNFKGEHVVLAHSNRNTLRTLMANLNVSVVSTRKTERIFQGKERNKRNDKIDRKIGSTSFNYGSLGFILYLLI